MSASMLTRRSESAILLFAFASGLICQTLVESAVVEEGTCVQGFAPAKRTLQAAQRDAPRTVMSSSEQVQNHNHPYLVLLQLRKSARPISTCIGPSYHFIRCDCKLLKVVFCIVQKNVLGGKLETCCTQPMTGFYRDGYCRVGPEDYGVHSVCSEMTTEFLEFSASRGNDLRSVVSAGERWCLCVSRYNNFLLPDLLADMLSLVQDFGLRA